MLSFLSQACYFLSKLRKSLYYALKPSHLRLLYPIFLFILSIIVVALLPWFSRGIYRVSSKDSIKDWSFFIKAWPSDQNKRVLGMFYSYKLCTYIGFTMVVLQQTWFWRFWCFFQTWRPKSLFLAFWSWEKHDQPFIRTHWEGLKCDHTKKISGFAKWVSQPSMIELLTLEVLSKQL